MTDISDIYGGAIDATQTTPAPDRSPLAVGTYTMKVLESERRERNGTDMVTFKFEIVGGDFDGRWHWNDYVLSDANAQRQKIGRQDLTRLVAATGLTTCSDTDILDGRTFQVDVTHGGKRTDGTPWINLRNYRQVTTPEPVADTSSMVASDALDEVLGRDDTPNDDIPF